MNSPQQPAPAPEPAPHGWAGLVHVLKSLTHAQIMTFAVVGVLVFLFWQGPQIIAGVNAQNLRVQQEERERDRAYHADRDARDRELNRQRDERVQLLLSTEGERNRRASDEQVAKLLVAVARLEASNQQLQQEIAKLNAILSKRTEGANGPPDALRPGRPCPLTGPDG